MTGATNAPAVALNDRHGMGPTAHDCHFAQQVNASASSSGASKYGEPRPAGGGHFLIILIRASRRQDGKEKLLFIRARIRIIRKNNPGLSLFAAATLSRSPHEFPESGFSGGLLAGPLFKRGEHLRPHVPGPVCAEELGLDRI